MRRLISIVLIAFTVGCVATTARTRRLSLGMGKQEVLKVMGSPTSVKAKDNEEVLEYLLWPTWSPSIYDKKQQFWVILKDGKLTQYGNAGDYDTAQPSDRREYNININK